jgi:C4-dicarboxylate transporter DctM subunit
MASGHRSEELIMDSTLITLLACALLLLLLGLKVHVALALAGAGLFGVILLGAASPGSVVQSVPFNATSTFSWTVLPMFILMGAAATASGLVTSIFRIANRVLRRLPGGIALATIVGCAGFGAVCGSSVATAATMGPIAGSEMARAGYRGSFAAGVVASAGTLGVLIPPSIILVMYGIVTGEPIGTLLLAGFVPGIISALVLGLTVVALRVLRPRTVMTDAALNPAFATTPARERMPALAGAGTDKASSAPPTPVDLGATGAPLPNTPEDHELSVVHSTFGTFVRLGLLVAAVIGGIYLGLVTATEAAAVGAFAALAIAVWDMRRFGIKAILRTISGVFQETASSTGMLFLIVVGSSIFSYFFVVAGVPSLVADWVTSLDIAPLAVVALILLVMIPLGMFLEPISMILIVIPLAYPIVVTDLGFSGIWFAILAVKMIELGLITPPVGLNVFVVAGVMRKHVTTSQAFRGVTWFVVADLVLVALLLFFPDLVLAWLPADSLG